MCYFIPIAMAAMAVATTAMQHQAQQQEADAYNAAAAQTHENARIAANNQYTQEQTKFNLEARQANQEGYASALKKAAAIGTSQAAAGAAGVTGISVDALLATEAQIGELNIDKARDKQNAAYINLLGAENNTQAEANMRIASTPFRSGPGNLFLKAALAGGTAFAGGMAAGGQLGSLFSLGSETSSSATINASTAAMESSPGYASALTEPYGSGPYGVGGMAGGGAV